MCLPIFFLVPPRPAPPRYQHQCQVCALLNDTTGCLMSCAWRNPKCRIGMILGTGTNACYLEDLDKVRS